MSSTEIPEVRPSRLLIFQRHRFRRGDSVTPMASREKAVPIDQRTSPASARSICLSDRVLETEPAERKARGVLSPAPVSAMASRPIRRVTAVTAEWVNLSFRRVHLATSVRLYRQPRHENARPKRIKL